MTRRISSSRPITGSSLPCRAAVALERLVGRLRRRRGHTLAATHFTQHLRQLVPCDSHLGEQPSGRPFVIRDSQQDMLNRNIFVLELLRFVFRLGEDAVEPAGDVGLVRRRPGRTRYFGRPLQFLLEPLAQEFGGHAGLGENGARQAALLLEKRSQQMLDLQLMVALADRSRLR